MSKETTNENYLDYIVIVIEAIIKAAESDKMSRKTEYDSGKIMGFNHVISIMQQTAQVMGIDQEKIGLNSINPDKDLV